MFTQNVFATAVAIKNVITGTVTFILTKVLGFLSLRMPPLGQVDGYGLGLLDFSEV